jgi:hypothetical protein
MLIVDVRLIDATKMPAEPEPLGELVIINDATGTSEIGNYVVRLRNGIDDIVIAEARVRRYPRKHGWRPLVALALQAVTVPHPAAPGADGGEQGE